MFLYCLYFPLMIEQNLFIDVDVLCEKYSCFKITWRMTFAQKGRPKNIVSMTSPSNLIFITMLFNIRLQLTFFVYFN